MFKSRHDIHQSIYEFQEKTNRKPNVIFVSYNNQLNFLKLIDSWNGSWAITNPCNINDIKILGMKLKWTENIEGVDYIEEFDNIDEQQIKPIIKNKPIKIKSNKRKIIL